MRKQSINTTGFSLIPIVAIILVFIVALLAGVYVYERNHEQRPPAGTEQDALAQKGNSGTSSTPKIDPYAGWKLFCDKVHYYCFKYPSDWKLTASGSSAAHLLDPGSTVQITYANPNVKDSAATAFSPASVTKLATANQDISVVGGYNPSSGNNGIAGNNIPLYEVVDSSLLDTYPLTVGQLTQFPNNPGFSDQYAGETNYNGEFRASPAITINTPSQSKAWLASADAKTGMKILESLYYKP